MRMKWAKLLSGSFFFFSFFLSFFFCFSSIFIAKKKELAIISLMMSVFGCVQKMASKIASFFFFFLRLNFRVLAHDCDQDERKRDQKNGTRENSATGTEKIFRALINMLSVTDFVRK